MPEHKQTLEAFRSQILDLDRGLIKLLAERFKIVDQVGKLKKENNLPPLDQTQWLKVLDTRKTIAKESGVDEELITEILESIHKEALRIEG